MSHNIKKIFKGEKKKMAVLAIENHSIENVKNYNSSYPFSKLASKDLCQNINRNLFKLEQEVAFFKFAVQEISDVANLTSRSKK